MQETIQNWRLAVIPHAEVAAQGLELRTAAAVLANPHGTIPASVPGNFELDLMREGLLEDLYYADNVLQAQKLENRHLWYCTEFDTAARPGCDTLLEFGGIDTAAEIYLDGELLGKTENMFIPHTFPLAVADGRHSLVVHIIPAQIYTRQFSLPAIAWSLPYNFEQLKLRKATHMYGWDILPRIMSGGLWRPVTLHYRPRTHIQHSYLYTRRLADDGSAQLDFVLDWQTDDDYLQDYTVEIEGHCEDSVFRAGKRLFSTHEEIAFTVPAVKLWWPKNYGEPKLYEVTVTLRKGDQVAATQQFRTGIRTVWLDRTPLAGDDGEFVFLVNGQKVFAMGTNWVPADAFPSRDREYLLRGLEMVNDLGCNIIRCWGGNIYPDDLLYEYCDEHGILIWQDFSMACGIYPDDERTCRLMEQEVTAVVQRLRNHPALLLWSGDNECDQPLPDLRAIRQGERRLAAADPNDNRLTRQVIPAVLRREDYTRPYLPSSPYIDAVAFEKGGLTSEDHLWGPRDFFKGDFYMYSQAHFASETGYHGCPSPRSLERFLSPKALQSLGDGCDFADPEWRLHGASPTAEDGCYTYRNPLMYRQVERLFGTARRTLADFARQSQISQAEAKKFFIEHFRVAKWRRTGIIWWNLIDGWPQISDAIVDYYYTKKLAYAYIKRSQQPVCLMFDEPDGRQLPLVAVNDLRRAITVRYTVTAASDGHTVAEGHCTVQPDEAVRIDRFTPAKNEVYGIRWQGDVRGMNHYTAGIGDPLDYDTHLKHLEALGFTAEFEGF